MSNRRAFAENLGVTEVITALPFTGPGPVVIPIHSRPKNDYAVNVTGSVLSTFAVTAKTTNSFTLTSSASGAMLLDIHIQ